MLVAVKQVLDYMEEFYAGKSKPVNLELQQIMVQLDYIEQTGHGVPLIVSRYGREVFDISENFITVTIPLNHKRNEKDNLSIKQAKIIDNRDGKILELMKENPNISVREVSRLVDLGTTIITERIRRLKEEGIVERKGSKKTG